jgi:hypothetical protein
MRLKNNTGEKSCAEAIENLLSVLSVRFLKFSDLQIPQQYDIIVILSCNGGII